MFKFRPETKLAMKRVTVLTNDEALKSPEVQQGMVRSDGGFFDLDFGDEKDQVKY